jgi:RNA polymerase sigma-70 factor (ECF subfamily)
MICVMHDAASEFNTLVRRFERPLISYAARIIGDRERAHDVVQETFLEADKRRRAESGKTPSITAKWLFTVCRNRALNVCRKERRLQFVNEAVFETSAENNQLPSQQLEQKEASGFLQRIIATLPLRQQEVLQLRFQNNLSYQEISEIMNTSVNNIGVLIHTALKELRRRYAPAAAAFIPIKLKRAGQ